MEGTNLFVLFIVGFVLGCVLVMLLWMASPACLSIPGISGAAGVAAGTSANLTPASGTYTNMVIRDQGGRTIATTGDKGTLSTFTDENGKKRNVMCYMSYYCVDQTPCENNQCIQKGQRCSLSTMQQASAATANYNPATGAYTGTSATAASQCCSPYECINGYCGETQTCVKSGEKCSTDNDCCQGQCTNGVCGQNTCQQENDRCGNVYPQQTTTTMMVNQQPTYYGECCSPYECVNNTCTPQQACVQTGKICGRVQDSSIVTAVVYKDYGECCSPDECVNNVCGGTQQCVQTGQTCGTTYPAGATANYPIQHGDCCAPDQCVNNVCTPQETCQKTNAICGYGPPVYTTVVANRTWHGDCCSGDTCVDGYCQPQCGELNGKCSSTLACCEGYCVASVCQSCEPVGYACKADSECCQGYTCQNGKCSSCMKQNSECSKDADCCNGLVCFDGTCKLQGACGEAGQTCGLGVKCCEGMECSDNDVCVECAPVGDSCGGQYTGAGGSSCCSTGYCYSGTCKQKTKYLCEDTETGPDYYSPGSATGVFKGVYGTYTDYCLTSASGVVDYYCEVNGENSEIQTAQVTCPNGCSGGACK